MPKKPDRLICGVPFHLAKSLFREYKTSHLRTKGYFWRKHFANKMKGFAKNPAKSAGPAA